MYLCTDHSGLNKFAGTDDPNLLPVRIALEGMAKESSAIIQKNYAGTLEARKTFDVQLQNSEHRLEATERAKILNWISSQPYLAHHTQNNKDVLPGTGQWLFNDPIFKQWRSDSSPSVLWLHGISGSGKSKLVSIVIEGVSKHNWMGQNTRLAYFYCSRNNQEPARSSPEAILASLARQLQSLENDTSIPWPALTLYRSKETEGFISGNLTVEETSDLLVDLIACSSSTTLVLDALDECNRENRGILLDALQEILVKSAGVAKVLVSCREEGDLVYELRKHPGLKISSDKNSRDISAFVRTETQRLVDKGRLLRHSHAKEELKTLIITKLIDKADGM